MARPARGIDYRHAWKWQLAVDSRDSFVSDKKIQRRASREIQHVERYEAVVEIARSALDDGRGQIDRKRDRSARRTFERPRAEVHVLRIVEELDRVMPASVRHRGDAQKTVLHDHHRIRFA